MAVVMIEGFDHYTAAEATSKGWSNTPSSMQPGRFDGQSALITGTRVMNKTLPSTYTTLFTGFAFQYGSTPSVANQLLRLETTGAAALVANVSITTGDKLVVGNTAGTTVATGTTTLVHGSWYYLELEIVVNGASGTCELHLNGAVEIASTVGNFGSTAIAVYQIESSLAAAGVQFDDIYVADNSGSAPRNTFLGDVRVETVYPNATGTNSQWTPNGTTPNYACVDENPPDGDATYVSSNTPGNLDSYLHGTIDGAATVFGVQTNHYARKDDANTRQIAPLIRQAGTNYVGTTVSLNASYQFYSQIYNQDPTNTDWTPATFNGDEFGIEEIA